MQNLLDDTPLSEEWTPARCNKTGLLCYVNQNTEKVTRIDPRFSKEGLEGQDRVYTLPSLHTLHFHLPLPPCWSPQKDGNGFIFFANLQTKEVSWNDPRRPLPVTWQQMRDMEGMTYFQNHLTNEATHLDPRKPLPPGWQMFMEARGPYYQSETGEKTWVDPRDPLPDGWSMAVTAEGERVFQRVDLGVVMQDPRLTVKGVPKPKAPTKPNLARISAGAASGSLTSRPANQVRSLSTSRSAGKSSTKTPQTSRPSTGAQSSARPPSRPQRASTKTTVSTPQPANTRPKLSVKTSRRSQEVASDDEEDLSYRSDLQGESDDRLLPPRDRRTGKEPGPKRSSSSSLSARPGVKGSSRSASVKVEKEGDSSKRQELEKMFARMRTSASAGGEAKSSNGSEDLEARGSKNSREPRRQASFASARPKPSKELRVSSAAGDLAVPASPRPSSVSPSQSSRRSSESQPSQLGSKELKALPIEQTSWTKDWRKVNSKMLGEGAFGKIWGVVPADQREVPDENHSHVMKLLSLAKLDHKQLWQVQNEMRLHGDPRLSHPYIVAFHAAYQSLKVGAIIMEKCDTTLHHVMASEQQRGVLLPESWILAWIAQLCLAINHLHRNQILHLDLKPANVFLKAVPQASPEDAPFEVRLGDFGLARTLFDIKRMEASNAGMFEGTPMFAAPETIKDESPDFKTDVWAVGVILYCLCSYQAPFGILRDWKRDFAALRQRILTAQPPPLPKVYSPGLNSLLNKMLAKNRKYRPVTGDVLREKVIQQYLPIVQRE